VGIFNLQFFSLVVGMVVGLLIMSCPFRFMKDKCHKTLITMEDPEPMAQLLLVFEVLILPPLVYSSVSF
jgi:hypothetical protein